MVTLLNGINRIQVCSRLIGSPSIIFKDFQFQLPTKQQKCSYYPEAYVKKKRFLEVLEKKYQNNETINYDESRKHIMNTVRNETKLDKEFFENLKIMIYLAKNISDLKLILQCFDKFGKISDFKRNSIAYAPLYIRKLVSLDEIKFATDVFLNKNNSFNFMDHISSALALLDVLMDQKMYDEAINLFELKFMKSDKFAKSVFIPITLSLLIKNDKDALKKAKLFVSHMHRRKFNLPIGSVFHIFYLAFKQDDIEYAFKFIGKTQRIHKSLYCNILVIGLSHLNQTSSAIEYAEKLLEVDSVKISDYRAVDSIDGKIFQTTLKYLNDCISKSNDADFKERHELFIKQIGTERLIQMDIEEYFTNPSFGLDHKSYKF